MFRAISLLCLLGLSASALASPHTGTLVHLKGQVRIFKSPSLTAHAGKGQQVLFEERYYLVEDAKIGSKVLAHEILATGPDGKAKLIFVNGDTIIVGSGTAYHVGPTSAEPGAAKSKGETLHLVYGKLRALVSKSGPRRRLEIRTPTAVAGVRGTDLHIKQLGSQTQLTVLRGRVEVASVGAPTKKEVIEQGSTARLREPQATAPEAIEVRKATKVALAEIQQDSTIEVARDLSALTKETQKELAALDQQAKEAALRDLRSHNPSLFKKLKNQKNLDITAINASAVETLAASAPEGPAKPSLEDLAPGTDPYTKYFSPVPR